MNISVIIPTFRRHHDLVKCLDALKKQSCLANQVIVIVRDIDIETQSFLETYERKSLALQIEIVTVPGQVAALNVGLDKASGEIIAITDDDAIPHPDWLKLIKHHFSLDSKLGGVGGKDIVYYGDLKVEGKSFSVGKVQWFGRVIGNHHLGYGEPKEVDVLKGANMSFRAQAIENLRFDPRLRGTGAQVHNDMAFCLSLKKAGWKIIYDPAINVDHYPAPRFDEDRRNEFKEEALVNAVHNETLILMEYLPPIRKVIFFIWINLVGTGRSWGFVQMLRFLIKEDPLALLKWMAAIKGRWIGWQTWRSSL